ncbi:MAG TPA: class I tRNA ligase family protein, partial [Chitinophagaceae bacterium]|nr:class I tRNA ligase family protein [Chitinophagaceae bacterium]
DMFPYPSGAGLHVGHPLGYIASDIFSRYKRLKGFNVLHPMGFDSFGLPAEQYALDTGQHPAVTTKKNIETFKKQLDNIGFCYDWDREVQTSDPNYYKWTQWIFLQLFDSFYNRQTSKAGRIAELTATFELEGNVNHPCPGDVTIKFTAVEWRSFDEKQKMNVLMEYRLAFCGYGEVNWCEALGTVLANDEVVNGVSERGGHPVVKKKLRQWYLRITEYADRLLEGLDRIEFSDAMKEMQTNWIGKSSGAEIDFAIKGVLNTKLRVYTTRPDTIFGADFMVIAPELELVKEIKSEEQTAAVDEYLAYVKSRSERERMAEKKISGVFTGAYAINPFSGREIPIWISEYVLAGYGTGAIMAVPCGDERDHKFARHFNIPITNIIGSYYNGEEANPTKEATLQNSGFLDGMVMKDAMEVAIQALEDNGIGVRKVNYKMRDAAFSRQRYWGEPFPIVWKNGIAYPLDESELPLELPHVDSYKPGPDGEGPLANISEWVNQFAAQIPPTGGGGALETNTMPGYAGSSWYFLRYMDPQNDKAFCDRKVSDYWNQVDLYIGGTEHAVGHLLYSRMWTKVLFDLGYIGFDEPYKKLVNQGMIQGSSRFVYRVSITPSGENRRGQVYVSKSHYERIDEIKNDVQKVAEYLNKYVIGKVTRIDSDSVVNINSIHVDVNLVDGVILDISKFRSKWPEGDDVVHFILEEDNTYICGTEVEKMSKSKFNTVNPDDLVMKYGADTFRMYEMFLGPVEMSKPWDTKGIEGVHRFLKKFWRLFADETKGLIVNDAEASAEELKVLHKTIKKIEEDTERFSFNTAVSGFMIATNELTDLKCHKRSVLEPILILLTPYAPHIAAELWSLLGHSDSILDAAYPKFEAKYVAETSKEYPISINGKLRTTMNIALDAAQPEVEKIVLENEVVQKWLEGKPPKKIIFVKGKMVNVVI